MMIMEGGGKQSHLCRVVDTWINMRWLIELRILQK
jgi:hypothetical protein